MEIDPRISIVHMVFFQITRGTEDHALRFGYVKGEFIASQPNLNLLNPIQPGGGPLWPPL